MLQKVFPQLCRYHHSSRVFRDTFRDSWWLSPGLWLSLVCSRHLHCWDSQWYHHLHHLTLVLSRRVKCDQILNMNTEYSELYCTIRSKSWISICLKMDVRYGPELDNYLLFRVILHHTAVHCFTAHCMTVATALRAEERLTGDWRCCGVSTHGVTVTSSWVLPEMSPRGPDIHTSDMRDYREYPDIHTSDMKDSSTRWADM